MKIRAINILVFLIVFPAMLMSAQNQPITELSPQNVWVFMMAGQSNMAGRGTIEAQDTIANPRILSLNAEGELVLAKEPLHFYEPKMAGLDCGVSFANELLKSVPDSISILMVPTAVGGSSIRRWLDDKPHRGVNLQSNFKEKMMQARKYGELKAVLWHQGESDVNHTGVSMRFENMKELFGRFRESAENDSLPILVGELGAYSKDPQTWCNMNAENHRYVFSDPNSRIISTSDLTDRGDKLHFNSKGQRTIGHRFAEKYRQEFMQQEPSSTQPPVVVMTFDDAEIGQYSIASYLLKKHNFGGTFFICEFPVKSPEDKTQYMSWEQIKEVNDLGFEIGNHTGHHRNVTKLSKDEIVNEVRYIEDKCLEYGIPKPVSFAYPGNRADSASAAVLDELGYQHARVGGSRRYIIGEENNLFIPSYTVCTAQRIQNRVTKALNELEPGQIVVLLFHGIPDLIHPDYSTSPAYFEAIVDFMDERNFKVIALRDLDKYLISAKDTVSRR